MEVHPPEHPIFTWKQFFIHMSTICLGLLIALGRSTAASKCMGSLRQIAVATFTPCVGTDYPV